MGQPAKIPGIFTPSEKLIKVDEQATTADVSQSAQPLLASPNPVLRILRRR